MSLTLLYHGPLWDGSTSLQRLKAFAALDGVRVIAHDSGARVAGRASTWYRIRWKLRWPEDALRENERLVAICDRERPDAVFVDNSRVIQRNTLARLRQDRSARLIYYSPDDIMGRHNLSIPLKQSLPVWDVVFTTKTFNIPELVSAGVRRPALVGKAYDTTMHFPLTPRQVGPEYERFDVVFVGTYERQRAESINALAEAGLSVVVYGSDKGGWTPAKVHPAVALRRSVFAQDYAIAWHTGKVALCFLRKLNRDRITQRTMEVAAMGRAMVAERTDEHDQHFADGSEYLGFSDDAELLGRVRYLLSHPDRRAAMMIASRARCERSGYSTLDRARQMIHQIQSA